MITITNQLVNGFDAAFRGMRNPLESWNKSDSITGIFNEMEWGDSITELRDEWMAAKGYDLWDAMSPSEIARLKLKSDEILNWLWDNSLLMQDFEYSLRTYIGPKDMALAQKLISAGEDESKFLRQINISVDITAPLYWWKEMDTYKVGTTANSTSTMHKLAEKELTINDFSIDEEVKNIALWDDDPDMTPYTIKDAFEGILENCNIMNARYKTTKDKKYWRALIQLLPESYNQTRTWTANYAVLRNIYFARRNHKLSEWRDFCKWIESLPYAKELICLEERKGK